jgi:1,4-alpha-glucan branching enzyme
VSQANVSMLTKDDLFLFNEGSHFRLYDKMGAHAAGGGGTHFAVWAPNARTVSLSGDFNGWNGRHHALSPLGDSGVWSGVFPEVGKGALYKYHIVSQYREQEFDKADPFAFLCETPPKTASVVWDLDYVWSDQLWMSGRHSHNSLSAPESIYELHLGSWKRVPNEDRRSLTYREAASELVRYVEETGFTHIELLPIMEHPFFGSWGYQTTGYFAPTSRYGTPQDFMYLVDCMHQHGIGVILDWVPSHFPADGHGLDRFDGTHLYEHADPRQGLHPDWNSSIFNYGRHEVVSFLGSSALFWLDKYHADGLRVDAVASMLYNDYSRGEGEWLPNQFGGKENLEAIAFLKRLNVEVYKSYPGVQTIAEESTAWPMVSRPTYLGGLGFGLKWDMGWMHDTLEYMTRDPVYRKYSQDKLTFRQLYSGFENFVLALSHDEVVHGKGSLIGKMPGDDWQQFANLRLLLGYMYGQNGKKLLFMGGEFAQRREWNHDDSLDWHLAGQGRHAGMRKWVDDLNRVYRQESALHELDCENAGFEWIDCNDSEQSVVGFMRKGYSGGDLVVVVCNFTPVPRAAYRLGVPRGGWWRELLNSDALEYGGSGLGNAGGVEATPETWRERPATISLLLPPLAILILKSDGVDPATARPEPG